MIDGFVSVVIPTYNLVHTIWRAVDSILSQDYPTLEVIVVDDGSTDGTAEVLRAAYADDARVIVLHQPNAGVCVARNADMTRARGEFVARLDSDDAWLPGKLRLQVAVLQAHPELGLVWTDMAARDVKAYRNTHRSMSNPAVKNSDSLQSTQPLRLCCAVLQAIRPASVQYESANRPGNGKTT